MDTIYIKPGLKIHKFEDESADIITVVTITLLSPAEFNLLAMEAPIVKRMVEYIKCDYVGYAVDYPRACMRDSLLTDIKALEKPE